MLQAMYNGVSAISATQEDMNIIGNDIANVNTTAYKNENVTFADQLSQTLQGASSANGTIGGTNPIQTGTGVKVASISETTSQGSLLSTSSPTDLAIQGNGYFMLANTSSGTSYTRDGHFAVDNSGNLVDASTGEYVLGWQANAQGAIDTSSGVTSSSKIQVAVGKTTAVSPTANISFTGNLSADTAANGSVSATEKVYDSLGEAHDVTITFTRAADASGNPTNTWNWTASGDPGLSAASGTTNQGSVTFGSDGTVASQTGSLLLNPTNGAATAQAMNLDFSGVSQVSGTATFGAESQDGYPSGTLQSFSINDQGVISGSFSNGLTRSLGQIAVAGFDNPQGLNKIGNNEYTPTVNSGEAVVSQANTLGLGSISSGYLEQSNVDLGTSLTNMIVAQRAFEANTKIVTAVNSMLGTLIQMDQP